MSSPSNDHSSHEHVPLPGEASIPELEEDENVAPRPEEAIADALRAEPDVADHSEHPHVKREGGAHSPERQSSP